MESTLYLMKNVDLDPNYNYTIDFDTEQAQSAYFDSKISNVLEYDEGYSYIKFNEPIKVYQNIDELFGVNYLMFTNNNKMYYAFILNKKWVSDTCTALEFKIDVMQTFMFDYSIDESFIEREHQDKYNQDLTPIFNLNDEGLEFGGELKSTYLESFTPSNYLHGFSGWYLIKSKEPLGQTYNFGTATWNDDSGVIQTSQGNFSTGIYVYAIPAGFSTQYYNPHKITTINNVTNTYTTKNHESMGDDLTFKYLSENPNVLSIQFVNCLDEVGFQDIYGFYAKNADIVKIWYNDTLTNFGFKLTKASGDGFDFTYTEDLTPKNYTIENLKSIENEPKLLTHPYNYFNLMLYGEYLEYKRELFDKKGEYKFRVHHSFNLSNEIGIIPEKYKNNSTSNYKNKSLSSNKNELTLRTDKWLDYQQNNKASVNGGLAVAGAQALGNIALGALTGGLGLALAGGQVLNYAGQVANTMLQRKDIQQSPDEVRKVSGDINLLTEMGGLSLSIHKIEIQQEFKNKIFNYLYHFGYKCNDFKKPNVRSRYYFNYIKTIGANIKTNIDADYKAEIMQIYDAGITIWHYRNKETFKGVNNYDYENVEMNLI